MEIGWRPTRDNDWVIVPDNTTRFQAIANHFSLFLFQGQQKSQKVKGDRHYQEGNLPGLQWASYFAAFAQVAILCDAVDYKMG